MIIGYVRLSYRCNQEKIENISGYSIFLYLHRHIYYSNYAVNTAAKNI